MRFATIVRDMPHFERAALLSLRAFTATELFSTATAMSSAAVKESSPLGPFTFTVWPETEAVTPLGTGTGFLPMRDIYRSTQSFIRARLRRRGTKPRRRHSRCGQPHPT